MKNTKDIKAEIKELAKFRSQEACIVYGDGDTGLEQVLPMYELNYILDTVFSEEEK